MERWYLINSRGRQQWECRLFDQTIAIAVPKNPTETEWEVTLIGKDDTRTAHELSGLDRELAREDTKQRLIVMGWQLHHHR